MAEIKGPWYKGHGPLHMAASAGKMAVCKLLIKDLKLDVNAAADDGNFPLFHPFCSSCYLVGSLCCDLWGKRFVIGAKKGHIFVACHGNQRISSGDKLQEAEHVNTAGLCMRIENIYRKCGNCEFMMELLLISTPPIMVPGVPCHLLIFTLATIFFPLFHFSIGSLISFTEKWQLYTGCCVA